MPKASSITFTRGPRQLVVQLALEITRSFAGSSVASFTPMTMVRSASPEGALMITWLTLPWRWTAAWARLVNLPVHSSTTWAPWAPKGMSWGSFSA